MAALEEMLAARQEILLHAEQHAMDRLELQPFVVDVFNLDQRVAGGVIHAHLGLIFSQMALAVASEWLPSPMANSSTALVRAQRRIWRRRRAGSASFARAAIDLRFSAGSSTA